jgi:hypothetical protein
MSTTETVYLLLRLSVDDKDIVGVYKNWEDAKAERKKLKKLVPETEKLVIIDYKLL